MNTCPAVYDEITHDLKQLRFPRAATNPAVEQRREACELAIQFLAVNVSLTNEWGGEFSQDDLMVNVWDSPAYPGAFMAQANGNPMPMLGLTLRCARHAAAVHLFGAERAYDLGFNQ